MSWPSCLPHRMWRLVWLVIGLLVGLVGCERAQNNHRAANAIGPAGGVRLQAVLGDSDLNAQFAKASPEVALRFPADYGAHPQFRSEWWYLTMMLADDQGREYGGQFTLFRQGLSAPEAPEAPHSDNPWLTQQLYLGHLAASDIAGGRHRFAERISRAHPQLAGVQARPFAAWLDNWRLASVGNEFLPITLEAASQEFAWRLSFDSERPLVAQGHAGYSAKGPDQGSHYYSLTRLQARGSLTLDDRQIAVQGSAWLDREWSTSVLSAGQVGWDWFALQLDDGRDLMLFRLRRVDCQRDPFDHGVLVNSAGVATHLGPEQFRLVPLKQWSGPGMARLQTVPACAAQHAPTQPGQGPWPLEWQLQLGDEVLVIRAALFDQRMQTSVQYWEGLVHLFDADGQRRLGRGFMELTGY